MGICVCFARVRACHLDPAPFVQTVWSRAASAGHEALTSYHVEDSCDRVILVQVYINATSNLDLDTLKSEGC